MLRSMVVALAAVLAIGPARDRTSVSEPQSEGDSLHGLDRAAPSRGAGWALPRDAKSKRREPVSEL